MLPSPLTYFQLLIKIGEVERDSARILLSELKPIRSDLIRRLSAPKIARLTAGYNLVLSSFKKFIKPLPEPTRIERVKPFRETHLGFPLIMLLPSLRRVIKSPRLRKSAFRFLGRSLIRRTG